MRHISKRVGKCKVPYNSRLHNKIACWPVPLFSLAPVLLNPPNCLSSIQVLFSQDVLTDFTS